MKNPKGLVLSSSLRASITHMEFLGAEVEVVERTGFRITPPQSPMNAFRVGSIVQKMGYPHLATNVIGDDGGKFLVGLYVE